MSDLGLTAASRARAKGAALRALEGEDDDCVVVYDEVRINELVSDLLASFPTDNALHCFSLKACPCPEGAVRGRPLANLTASLEQDALSILSEVGLAPPPGPSHAPSHTPSASSVSRTPERRTRSRASPRPSLPVPAGLDHAVATRHRQEQAQQRARRSEAARQRHLQEEEATRERLAQLESRLKQEAFHRMEAKRREAEIQELEVQRQERERAEKRANDQLILQAALAEAEGAARRERSRIIAHHLSLWHKQVRVSKVKIGHAREHHRLVTLNSSVCLPQETGPDTY
ncbi:hypothetical protein KIPB_001229 [Kipferlia bialata]|uniref:Uncharacterized protein n=1 Tax=Kipferlia bialata TaxID=797122 RepID=A0A9K3GFF4_9EUKA|nr:hypothetical protein KIPB_001229 [Kipferlia bialata]|eukprot:g1229.t1